MKYFDSHAHYYDERFADESPLGANGIIRTHLGADVSGIVNVGTSPETCLLAIEQAKEYEGMYTALGIHPSDCRFLSNIDSELSEIEALIKDKASKCVALGEIGLDYHYPDTDKEKQHRYLHAQMSLASELNIPVVIHDRDSHEDVMRVLTQYKNVRGILHSFSGSAEMARELLKMGYYISFSGVLTFTNARRIKEVAAIVPSDRMLIETDCPYLAPHPLRGTLNHSGNLSYTNAALAVIKGLSEEECAQITEDNARRIFGL